MTRTASNSEQGIAAYLWDRFGELTLDDVPEDVRRIAAHSVLDWLGCALAGSREPLSGMLRDEFAAPAGAVSLVGSALRASVGHGALINGAAGHALDYDDTSMVGHPTAPVLPAVLAVAEERCLDGREVLAALVAGVEVENRVQAANRAGCPAARLAHHVRDGRVRRRGGCGPSAAPRPGTVRPRHGSRGFPVERRQGQLRHHDQAVPCRHGGRSRSVVGPPGRAGLHRQSVRHRREPGPRPGHGSVCRPAAPRGIRRTLVRARHAIQAPCGLLSDALRHQQPTACARRWKACTPAMSNRSA